MKIAITGAYSYTGKYITHRLLARGDHVLTLTNRRVELDPFQGNVEKQPLDFSNPRSLTDSLKEIETLVNTYWVRFDKGEITQSAAVINTGTLIKAAQSAGVRKIIHISVTNPSPASPLPYFSGKAANEKFVLDSGLAYAILRPSLIYGKEDILINNIAWILRNFPIMALPGDGSYRVQPVDVLDVAELAIQAIDAPENVIWDAVGPDIFTFREMVEIIGRKIGRPRLLLSTPPRLAFLAAQLIGLMMRDVLLTFDEVEGLMAGLLVSAEPARGKLRLEEWLSANKGEVGIRYANELTRHYQSERLPF